MLLKKVNNLLISHQYKVDFSSYHREEDLLKHRGKEKNINEEKFLTIYTKDGLVIGRVIGLKENSSFTKRHLEEIKSFFVLYRLPSRLSIIEKLDEFLKE